MIKKPVFIIVTETPVCIAVIIHTMQVVTLYLIAVAMVVIPVVIVSVLVVAQQVNTTVRVTGNIPVQQDA